jgi:hypothetical protein
MNSNFEWQRQQTNQRLEARLREAQAHRATQKGEEGQEHVFFPLPVLHSIGRALTRLAARGGQKSADNSARMLEDAG